MTQPPHIDGLPLWLQAVLSVIFGLAALGAAYKGYFTKSGERVETRQTAPQAQLMAATIADMGAIRNFTDAALRLEVAVQGLCREIEDAKHHERNNVEVTRELCGRLRALTEMMERQSKGY